MGKECELWRKVKDSVTRLDDDRDWSDTTWQAELVVLANTVRDLQRELKDGGEGFTDATIYRHPKFPEGSRFIRLPRNSWKSAGPCHCPYCRGAEGFWDTLALPQTGRAYTVHFPELEREGEVIR